MLGFFSFPQNIVAVRVHIVVVLNFTLLASYQRRAHRGRTLARHFNTMSFWLSSSLGLLAQLPIFRLLFPVWSRYDSI